MTSQATARMTVHWLWKAIYVLGLVFFLSLALLSVFMNQLGSALVFLGFSALMVLALVLARSYVEVDDDKLFVFGPPFGKYILHWDEIISVETNGIGYVFRGDDKALGFNTMLGQKATDVRKAIDEQIARRKITVARVKQTPTVMPKNVRVQ